MKTSQKGLFLDRDGVVNREIGDYVFTTGAFKLMPGIKELISYTRSKGYIIILITNQGGIAKGLYTIEEVDNLHNWMQNYTGNIDKIYFCPHHPSVGACLCRKPSTLNIEKAADEFGIDLGQSFFIGDRQKDMEAGKKAGCTTIFIQGSEKHPEMADFAFPDILSVDLALFS